MYSSLDTHTSCVKGLQLELPDLKNWPYLSPCFIILQVHQGSGVLRWTTWVILLPLSGIHKLPGEPVAVMNVVATASPQPVAWQVPWSGSTAASASGELTFAARPANGVDHTSRTDGISEGCFPGAWKEEETQI